MNLHFWTFIREFSAGPRVTGVVFWAVMTKPAQHLSTTWFHAAFGEPHHQRRPSAFRQLNTLSGWTACGFCRFLVAEVGSVTVLVYRTKCLWPEPHYSPACQAGGWPLHCGLRTCRRQKPLLPSLPMLRIRRALRRS